MYQTKHVPGFFCIHCSLLFSVKIANNAPAYFAEKLYKSMKVRFVAWAEKIQKIKRTPLAWKLQTLLVFSGCWYERQSSNPSDGDAMRDWHGADQAGVSQVVHENAGQLHWGKTRICQWEKIYSFGLLDPDPFLVVRRCRLCFSDITFLLCFCVFRAIVLVITRECCSLWQEVNCKNSHRTPLRIMCTKRLICWHHSC